MKRIIISIVLFSTMLSATANNFNMPSWGNNNAYNNGSSWNMPNMNWGNGNGYNNINCLKSIFILKSSPEHILYQGV